MATSRREERVAKSWLDEQEQVVTTNSEKSAEVIVGGNSEGPNNLKSQAKCM